MTTALLLATDHHDWFPWFPLIPLLLLGTVVVLFLTFGRRCRRGDARGSGESVLADRYARGEIDETEYRERRRVLRAES